MTDRSIRVLSSRAAGHRENVLRVPASIGLISASAAITTLLLLALNGAVKKLGAYARLHYRLVKPHQHVG